jgi:hypothetical protein
MWPFNVGNIMEWVGMTEDIVEGTISKAMIDRLFGKNAWQV